MTAGDPDTTDPHAAAHHYATRGWRVLPITPGHKYPPIKAWQDAATTDPATIDAWWTGLYRGHGVGIATGATSGIWVLDVDDYDAYRQLERANTELPETLTSITGSGGMHFVFAYPSDGRTIRNSAGTRLGAGLDVRGDGGQIVAPPTVHPNGCAYEWDAGQGIEPVHAPDWLLDLVCDAPEAPAPIRLADPRPDGGTSPGDALGELDWAHLLTADDWQLHHQDRNSAERYWTRPGKEVRDGISATTGWSAADNLVVFTSSMAHAGLVEGEHYTKLGYWASTRHHGDHSAAARDLAARGYGTTSVAAPSRGATNDEPWPQPTLPPEPTPPAFPLHALPDWAQTYVAAAAEQVQVPADLTAMLAIGALSAACTGRAQVQVSPNWTEPVNLYLVTAMRSGSGKSAAEKLCCGWLRTWHAERLAAVHDDWDLARRVARVVEKRATEVEKSMMMGNKTAKDLQIALAEAQVARDNVPELPRLLADDATPEAVAALLAAHGERLAIISTEADLFDMVLKGKPGQRASLNVYLKAWSGDSMIRDRKGGSDTGPESITLERPLMTVSVTVQPSVLRRLFADDEMVGRGFSARFMFALPPDLIGRRDQSRRFAAERLADTDRYHSTATALAEEWSTWAHPPIIHLDHAATDTLHGFLAEVEPQLAPGERYHELGEWVNKLHGSVVRYAGLLHLAEHHGASAPLTADTMGRAIDLGRYWLDTAAIVMSSGAAVEDQALALLEFMADDGRSEFTLTDLQKDVRRPGIGLDKVADYVPALQFLVDNSWLRPLRDGWVAEVGRKGTPAAHFSLWPECVGQPRRVHVPRVPRTASMGERVLSSPPPSARGDRAHAVRGTRGSQETATDSPPVDNSPPEPPPVDLSGF